MKIINDKNLEMLKKLQNFCAENRLTIEEVYNLCSMMTIKDGYLSGNKVFEFEIQYEDGEITNKPREAKPLAIKLPYEEKFFWLSIKISKERYNGAWAFYKEIYSYEDNWDIPEEGQMRAIAEMSDKLVPIYIFFEIPLPFKSGTEKEIIDTSVWVKSRRLLRRTSPLTPGVLFEDDEPDAEAYMWLVKSAK